MTYVRLEATLWAVRVLPIVLRPLAVAVDVFAPRLRPLRAGHSHRRIQW